MHVSLKRIFDVVSAAISLILLGPVLFLIALGVLLSNGFPVLFRQSRVGRNGRDFTLVKFRTMTMLASAAKGQFDMGNQKRVTTIGYWLRRSKLDELPQLWNVVCGDMSVVGPRPEVRKWVEAYPQEWAIIHTVRPGITDLASVAFRHEEEILAGSADPERTYREEILPRKLGLYMEYVRTRTFWSDIKIILQTIAALFCPARADDNAIKPEKATVR